MHWAYYLWVAYDLSQLAQASGLEAPLPVGQALMVTCVEADPCSVNAWAFSVGIAGLVEFEDSFGKAF